MTHYDAIAHEYEQSKLLPFRLYVELPTFFHALGNCHGQRIIDLACGEGFYTRLLVKEGATMALGVDMSAKMLKIAREKELLNPLGIQYQQSDAALLKLDQQFDKISAGYLLNYAATPERLLAFCKVAYRHLRPGGCFAGVNNNPFELPENMADYRQYQFIKTAPQGFEQGAIVRYTFFNDDGTQVSVDNYHLTAEIYESIFAKAGFKKFSWVNPQLSDEGLRDFSPAFWEPIINNRPIIGFRAYK